MILWCQLIACHLTIWIMDHLQQTRSTDDSLLSVDSVSSDHLDHGSPDYSTCDNRRDASPIAVADSDADSSTQPVQYSSSQHGSDTNPSAAENSDCAPQVHSDILATLWQPLSEGESLTKVETYRICSGWHFGDNL